MFSLSYYHKAPKYAECSCSSVADSSDKKAKVFTKLGELPRRNKIKILSKCCVLVLKQVLPPNMHHYLYLAKFSRSFGENIKFNLFGEHFSPQTKFK